MLESSQPKVLHIIESTVGGSLQIMRKICVGLEKEFEFQALFGERTPNSVADIASFLPAEKVRSWSAKRHISPATDSKALLEARRAIRDFDPDIIHAHSSKAGAIARIAAAGSGKPVIFSPHGYAFIRQDLSRQKRLGFQAVEKLLGKLPHLTVACCEAEALQARQYSAHVETIKNMVALPESLQARPKSAPSSAERPLTVGFAGSIVPAKNFPLFRDIAADCAPEEFQFRWIGDGDGSEKSAGFPKNLTITGWLDHASALETLSQCDIFMITSRWEALPNAALEALALGLPILSTPVGGMAEIVVSGQNGYFCENREEFLKRLKAFRESPELIDRMGEASKLIAEREFSVTKALAEWRELYARLYKAAA